MTPATIEDAKASLRRAAWRGHLFHDPTVHSLMGWFGADSSLPGAIRDVETARELVWLDEAERPFGYPDHELGIIAADGRRVFLQASREGVALPDPPPPDTAELDAARLLGWLRDQLSAARQAVGDPAGARIIGEADSAGQGTDHEFGHFTVSWRGRQVIVAVTAGEPTS